jgi:hypothetical protein
MGYASGIIGCIIQLNAKKIYNLLPNWKYQSSRMLSSSVPRGKCSPPFSWKEAFPAPFHFPPRTAKGTIILMCSPVTEEAPWSMSNAT